LTTPITLSNGHIVTSHEQVGFSGGVEQPAVADAALLLLTALTEMEPLVPELRRKCM
jgi:hypothetical protein